MRLLFVDKSAYVRGPVDAAEDDDLCVCALADDLAQFRQLRMDTETFAIALGAQRELAATARHRVPIPDLLIASCAQQHGADVVHSTGITTAWLRWSSPSRR